MNQEIIDEALDNLFTDEHFDVLEMLTMYNLEGLRKIGDVKETSIEENGLIQDTIEFHSFDGKYNYKKSNSYFSTNAKYEEVLKLNRALNYAVAEENYELAAELKTKKDNLLNTK